MDSILESAKEYLSRIPKVYYLPIAIFCIGIILLSIGLTQLLQSQNTLRSPQNSQSQQSQKVEKAQGALLISNKIQVDVEGAVMTPGVYKLDTTARVQDALVAAGGISGSADRTFVAKQINLAAKLTDGAKIYIPSIGEQNAGSQISQTSGNTQVLGASTDGLIGINSATPDQLDSLPGIGPVTAQKIIDARPFSSVDDLLTRKVVSKTVFEKIQDKVSVE